jgi:hypothetical protein
LRLGLYMLSVACGLDLSGELIYDWGDGEVW